MGTFDGVLRFPTTPNASPLSCICVTPSSLARYSTPETGRTDDSWSAKVVGYFESHLWRPVVVCIAWAAQGSSHLNTHTDTRVLNKGTPTLTLRDESNQTRLQPTFVTCTFRRNTSIHPQTTAMNRCQHQESRQIAPVCLLKATRTKQSRNKQQQCLANQPRTHPLLHQEQHTSLGTISQHAVDIPRCLRDHKPSTRRRYCTSLFDTVTRARALRPVCLLVDFFFFILGGLFAAVEENVQLVCHSPRVQPQLLEQDAAAWSDDRGRPRAEPVGAPKGLDQVAVGQQRTQT